MALFNAVPRQSLRWLLAELVVVVLGILIAFQVDRWREDRSNAEFVRASLGSILVDLDNDAEELALFIELSGPQIRAIDEFIAYLDSEESREEARLVALFKASSFTRTWLPIAPTYDSLRETGDFSLIRDPALREALFLYHEWTDYVRRTADGYLASRTRFIEAARQDIHYLPYLSDTRPEPLSRPVRVARPLSEIPRNPELIGALGIYGAGISLLRPILLETQMRNRELQEQIRRFLED